MQLTLAEGGHLSNALLSFLKDMQSSGAKSAVNPSHLFGQVCKKTPRFKGYQQQDSHELLRCLLDGMKTEEVKRAQAAILDEFKIAESAKSKAKLDPEVVAKVKAYGHQVSWTGARTVRLCDVF